MNKAISDCCENGVYEETDGTIHCSACTNECTYHQPKSWLRYQLTTINWMSMWYWYLNLWVVSLVINGMIDMYLVGDISLGYYKILVAVWALLYGMALKVSTSRGDMVQRLLDGWRGSNDDWHTLCQSLNEGHRIEKEALLKEIEDLKASK